MQLAGEVQARGERQRVRSDWMAVDASAASRSLRPVMSLEHEGLAFNLLGRPGHREFSEHAYPTLTAADSAVIVLDAAPMALRGHRGADL